MIETRNAPVLTSDRARLKRNASIASWICLALGMGIMGLSLFYALFYGPLLLAAVVLRIVALTEQRLMLGITILLATVLLPGAEWYLIFGYHSRRTFEKLDEAMGEVKTALDEPSQTVTAVPSASAKPSPTPAPAATPAPATLELVSMNVSPPRMDGLVITSVIKNVSGRAIKAFKVNWSELDEFDEVTRRGELRFSGETMFIDASQSDVDPSKIFNHVILPGETVRLQDLAMHGEERHQAMPGDQEFAGFDQMFAAATAMTGRTKTRFSAAITAVVYASPEDEERARAQAVANAKPAEPKNAPASVAPLPPPAASEPAPAVSSAPDSVASMPATPTRPTLDESSAPEPPVASVAPMPPAAPAEEIMDLSPEALVSDVFDTDLRVTMRNFQKRYAGKRVRFTETMVRKNPKEQLLVFKGGGFLTTAYDVQVRLEENESPGFDSVNVGQRLSLIGTLDRIVPPAFGIGSNSIRIRDARFARREGGFSPPPMTSSSAGDSQPETRTVVGVPEGDVLNVRTAPAMTSDTAFTLQNGQSVRVEGESEFNGDTEWVPVVLGEQRGWVRSKFLRRE